MNIYIHSYDNPDNPNNPYMYIYIYIYIYRLDIQYLLDEYDEVIPLLPLLKLQAHGRNKPL